MKNCFLILLALMLASASFAQKKKNKDEVEKIPLPEMTIKNDKVTYYGIKTGEHAKDHYYAAALEWYKSFFKNPTNVLKSKNPGTGEIKGKARLRLYDTDVKSGLKTAAGLVEFEINVTALENSYEWTVTNIVWKQSSAFAIEKWITENDKAYHHNYANYLYQTDEYITKMISNLKEKVD